MALALELALVQVRVLEQVQVQALELALVWVLDQWAKPLVLVPAPLLSRVLALPLAMESQETPRSFRLAMQGLLA